MRRLLFILWSIQGISLAEAPLPPARPEGTLTDRAQITVLQAADATTSFVPSTPAVRRMVETALKQQSPSGKAAGAWRLWLEPKDVVGFKVTSAPGPQAGTRRAVVQALIESLLTTGHPARQIVIWDRRQSDLAESGFVSLAQELGVRCQAVESAGWEETKIGRASCRERV